MQDCQTFFGNEYLVSYTSKTPVEKVQSRTHRDIMDLITNPIDYLPW